jgi:putative N6-adenine-specific DNA methylase
MAEKHRFKKEREFKKRLEEKEENEEADILNFTFHKHDIGKNRGGHESFDRSGKDRRDRKEFGKGKDRKDFKRGGKRDFSKGKDFGKKKRFDDDED